jgi:phosphatidylglycerophosphatase A
VHHIIRFLATGFYVGKVPAAPGTAGTVIGVLFYILINGLSPILYIITAVTFIFMAAWAATKMQEFTGEQDPPEIVIDEMAGFLVTMAFHKFDISLILAGFVLFRVFDIVKPFPIRWVERHFLSGWGVVLDDVAAGIYANAALWFFGLLMPNL